MWPTSPFGYIALPPHGTSYLFRKWKGASRSFKARGRWTREYWVRFDRPQSDADGDGPYAEAAIDERFLVRADGEEYLRE